MTDNILHQLDKLDIFEPIDLKFAAFLSRLEKGKTDDACLLAMVLLSHTTLTDKHICLDLGEVSHRSLMELLPEAPGNIPEALKTLRTPLLEDWTAALKRSVLVGAPGDNTPLVLDSGHRLYTYRYFDYERRVFQAVTHRAGRRRKDLDRAVMEKGLERYFAHPKVTPDMQKRAALVSMDRFLSVISGGPGTGKTYTVTSIMALLLEQWPELKIALCAPTGKAAARLQESIKKAKETLPSHPSIRDLIPENAKTIHRLLGCGRSGTRFRHHKANPLDVDVVIIDEASMVSLSLMAGVFDALPASAGAILLGDKNQLASVESGAVFADICDGARCDEKSDASGTRDTCHQGVDLAGCVTELVYSYRFESSPMIGVLAEAVNQSDMDGAWAVVSDNDDQGVVCTALPSLETLEARIEGELLQRIAPLFNSQTVEDAFLVISQFRILCPNMRGNYGAIHINRLIEKRLQEMGMIDGHTHYHGQPVIVLSNDYTLQLYNGDVGIIWNDGQGGLKAFFPGDNGGYRRFSPMRLPAHETVYAMTIHKSQGSEFDHVHLVLSDAYPRLLSRELVYTGITRARKTLSMWTHPQIMKHALHTQVERWSGLSDYFQSAGGTDR